MTVAEFAVSKLVYCYLMDASETSGTRTRAHNEAVGGVAFSAHRFGLGADVIYDAAPPVALRYETAKRLGLRLISEGDHDHLQPLAWVATPAAPS